MPSRLICLTIFAVGLTQFVPRFCLADDDRKVDNPKPRIRITASPTVLPQGASCTLHTHATPSKNGIQHSEFFEGTIVKADNDGVWLAINAKGGYQIEATPVLSEIPILSRYFKNTGVGRVPLEKVEQKWFPVEEIAAIDVVDRPTGELSPGLQR